MTTIAAKRIKSDRRDGWYQFDSETASAVLKNKVMNRPLSGVWVHDLAEEMKAGRWAENGESLIFDSEAHLLDGQHRLNAVCEARTNAIFYCVFGVDKQMFDTMDQGKARTLGHVGAIRNVKYYNLTGTLVRYLLESNEGHASVGALRKTKVWGWRFDDYLRKNKDTLLETAALVSKVPYQQIKSAGITDSLLAYVYHVGKSQSKARAGEFLQGLVSGANLSSDSPVLHLRNRLKNVEGRLQLNQANKASYVLKAWCLFRDGVSCKQLRLSENEVVTAYSKFER